MSSDLGSSSILEQLADTDSFIERHIGPSEDEAAEMLKVVGFDRAEDLVSATVPRVIRSSKPLAIDRGKSEAQVLQELAVLAAQNKVHRSYIGMGYSDCITPPVILRNILENPGWYTQYTPYQAEIAQGRLEALLNFQTMVMDLTGMEIANASLLDEATAAAEAMAMAFSIKSGENKRSFFVSEDCHPQTIAVVQTRAEPLGIKVLVGNHKKLEPSESVFGALVQYPSTDGTIHDYQAFADQVHSLHALLIVAADILALALLKAPAEFGADIVVGSTQRFGVPMGYGGPHAGYLATRDSFKRQIPGRIVGVSKDVQGKAAIRLALQTREQHIRRDKATSNICTAQVLLAVVASMYAVYHGPGGVRCIAERVHLLTQILAKGLQELGFALGSERFFDTLRVECANAQADWILKTAASQGINFRRIQSSTLGISLDETTRPQDVTDLLEIFGQSQKKKAPSLTKLAEGVRVEYPAALQRNTPYLQHPVFNTHHSETEMLRYIRRLESKDLSLTTSMIPLGSCTMKLNATAEMLPITWPGFSKLHPFAPRDQAEGYTALIRGLEDRLAEITGFAAISLQPNAGSQGEYAGLLVIRAYHQKRGEPRRNVCLIPQSAHGTNPASAAMAGMKIVVVKCDEKGNIDVADLRAKADEHKANLAALMVTYPSTHGVFEEPIRDICEIVHRHGGQVYMDGANMNAQVGVCRPAEFGADVCHLNLHKTFCIPHGGGGPGMGPIGVKEHLAPFLPSHPVIPMGGTEAIGAISAAPWGSPSILPISYAYIEMMGGKGLKLATEMAILSANYIAKRLEPHFPVLYRGLEGQVAHECIIDLRPLKERTGIEVEDVAKRLMDYGFHAPTISFPVAGTMMIEPTESEPKAEIDRFCEAMISIRREIALIEEGKSDRKDNPLKNAPHTAEQVTRSEWNRPYTREVAAYPIAWVRERKFWPAVARIDAVYGERNLMCACPSIDEYQS